MSLAEVKEYLCTVDPKLRILFEAVELDLESLYRPPYVALIGAVVGQRIRYTEAKKIRGQIFQCLGTNFTPQDLLNLPERDRRKIGCNWELLDRVSREIVTRHGDSDSEGCLTIADIRQLQDVPGIGPWTIENTLVTSFLDWDIFPEGDKFLESRIRKLYGQMTRSEIRSVTERWSPYRTLVTWYLWRWF